MTGFIVDPAALQSNAPDYQSHAATLSEIYQTLTDSLNAEGDCWGNDDAGKAFAAKYVGPATSALNQIQATCQGLGTTAQGVYTWAQNYLNAQDADQQDIATQLGT